MSNISFRCRQITPNSLYYVAEKIGKTEVVRMEGVVRTKKVRDFNYTDLSAFAERAALYELVPPVEVKKEHGKGMHGGVCTGRLRESRRNRKSHAARRAQIVDREMKRNK